MAWPRRKWGWGLVLGFGLALALAGAASAASRPAAPGASPSNLERTAPPAPVATSAPAARPVYRGNLKSKKFHRPGCRYYHCPNCQAIFATREQALSAGYTPCKVCWP